MKPKISSNLHASGEGGRRGRPGNAPAMEGARMAQHAGTPPDRAGISARLSELANGLERETEIVHELKDALIRQREGVATSQTEKVNATVDAIGRILLTLDEGRRRRGTMLVALTGDSDLKLDQLEQALAVALPPSLVDARARLHAAAEDVTREIAINRVVLQRAVEAGETFLQALFSSTSEPAPVYGAGAPDEAAPGLLLNRRA